MLVWVASTILHDPGLGSAYSDIASVYYRVFVEHRGWYPGSAAPVPYCSYHFEYPPLVGSLWLVSTAAADATGTGLRGHYLVMALLLLPFYLLYAREVRRLAARLGHPEAAALALLLPSLLFYGVYNWDIAAAALMLLGLRLAAAGRLSPSAAALAAASAAKVYPFAAGLAAARELGGGARRFLAALAAATVVAWLPLLLCPRGLQGFLEHHGGWYIEGSLWLLPAGDPWSGWARAAAKAAMSVALLLALLPRLHGGLAERLVARGFLAVSALLLASYVYTPQMNLIVAPLALLAAPGLWPLVLLQDTAASLVIVLWFYGDPLGRLSPASIASYAKALLLLVLALLVYRRYREGRRRLGEG